jgi:hypothetical protein
VYRMEEAKDPEERGGLFEIEARDRHTPARAGEGEGTNAMSEPRPCPCLSPPTHPPRQASYEEASIRLFWPCTLKGVVLLT